MRVFSEKTVVSQELEKIYCNLCGNAVNKNELNYFDDYIAIDKTWGYHSPADGETHRIDICADCYFEWIKGFKIPPEVENGM